MKNKLTRAMLALAMTAPGFLLAAGNTLDTTEIESALGDMSTGFKSVVTTAAPVLVTILLTGLVLWVLPLVFRLAKKFFAQSGK